MATSYSEFNAMMQQMIDVVVTNVTKKTLDTLKQTILEQTYNLDPRSNAFYAQGSGEPTMEFFEAWEDRSLVSDMSKVVKEIFYNWEDMTFTPASPIDGDFLGVHSSFDGFDMRYALAEVLNRNGLVAKKQRGAYWDIAIAKIEKNIYKWFKSEFKKIGVM